MVSHPKLGSDPPIGSDRESGCDSFGNGEPMLDGYRDPDMVVDVDSRKSISRFLMTFVGGAVS